MINIIVTELTMEFKHYYDGNRYYYITDVDDNKYLLIVSMSLRYRIRQIISEKGFAELSFSSLNRTQNIGYTTKHCVPVYGYLKTTPNKHLNELREKYPEYYI